MKNNLHLWICFAACLAAVCWHIGRQFQMDYLEKNSAPTMSLAWYEFGKKVKVNAEASLSNGVWIKSLEGFSGKGFVSEREWDCLQDAKRFRNLGKDQLADLYLSEAADHRYHFSQQGRVAWIINNTEQNLHLQTYFFPLMIREAKDARGRWRPIEYLSFGFDQYDFDDMIIYPGEALPFHYKAYSGNFKTKIRFKILGRDGFYYSKPFTGYIDYGQFEEKKGAFSKFHEKLESFKYFVPREKSSCWAEDVPFERFLWSD